MADIQVTKENPTTFRVKLNVKDKDFAEAEKKAISNINNKVKLDGFRKGKVPERILKSKFKGDIIDAMVNSSLNQHYGDIMKKSPQPIFEITKIEKVNYTEERLDFEFVFESAPYVETGKFKDINIREHIISIEDKAIEKELKRLQKSQAVFQPTDDKTIKNQVGILADFEIWVNDAPSGEPVKGSRFILGEYDFDKDIETEILAQKPGIHQEITVKKSNPQGTEADGPSEYKIIVTITDVLAVELPPLDDSFANKVDQGVQTLAQLRDKIKIELEKSARNFNLDQEFKVAIDKLIETSTYHISDHYLDSKVNDFLQERKLERNHLTPEQLGQLQQSFVEQIKRSTMYDHIYSEANKDKAETSYRGNFKTFLQTNHAGVNSDAIMKLYEDVAARKQQLPEAFYSLLNRYLDEYNLSLMEKFFRAQGVFKKGKKFDLEEMQEFYKAENDQKKKK